MPQFDAKALNELVARELAKPEAGVTAPAPERPKRISPWAQLATIAGHSADIGTTVHALKKGAKEQNPIYGENPSLGKLVGIKAGGAALQVLLQQMLGKKNPKIANALGYGAGAAMAGLAAHNISQAKKK